MTKRKANKPHKADAETTGAAKPAPTPKRTVSAPAVMTAPDEALQAATNTETRLPDLPGQEIASALPPVPPPELRLEPAFPAHLSEPKLNSTVPVPVGVLAATKETRLAATSGATTADPPARMLAAPLVGPSIGPLGAIAGIEACQTLFMELTRDNLDFAASLAAMRSPLDLFDVATQFAGRQIGLYGRFSKTFVDIAAGRQAPMS